MVGPIANYEVIRIHDEGIKEGRKEGLKKGREEGLREGEAKLISTLSELVNDGILSLADAASRADMTVEEFQKAIANLTP